MGYVGPMASFYAPEGWKSHIEKPLKEDGSIDYPELVRRVDEYGRKMHMFYRRFHR